MAYDPVKAAEYATKAMNATSLSKCALYIRKAINAGGIPGSWGHAYQFLEKGADGLNPLERNGFNLIDHNQGLQIGDIGVLNRTKDHQYGHIQMWNGKQWVSDFGQDPAKIGPYRKYANGIAPGQTLRVFRYGAPVTSTPNIAINPEPEQIVNKPAIRQILSKPAVEPIVSKPTIEPVVTSIDKAFNRNVLEDLNRAYTYFKPQKPTLNLSNIFGSGDMKDLYGNSMGNPFSDLFRRF